MIVRLTGLVAAATLLASTQVAVASVSLTSSVKASSTDSFIELAAKGGGNGGGSGGGKGRGGDGPRDGADDGTPDQGPGCCEAPGAGGDDDGTPDQGPGDN